MSDFQAWAVAQNEFHSCGTLQKNASHFVMLKIKKKKNERGWEMDPVCNLH